MKHPIPPMRGGRGHGGPPSARGPRGAQGPFGRGGWQTRDLRPPTMSPRGSPGGCPKTGSVTSTSPSTARRSSSSAPLTGRTSPTAPPRRAGSAGSAPRPRRSGSPLPKRPRPATAERSPGRPDRLGHRPVHPPRRPGRDAAASARAADPRHAGRRRRRQVPVRGAGLGGHPRRRAHRTGSTRLRTAMTEVDRVRQEGPGL